MTCPPCHLLLAHGAAAPWQLPLDEAIVRVCGDTPAEIAAALAPDTEILVTDAMPAADAATAGLRWIQLMSAGYNQAIGHPLALRPGLRVSNAAGLCAGHMAEFIVGQMLRHVKRWDEFAVLQHRRTWPDRAAMATPPLRGRRALIVGYGGVGRETARLLTALGVVVDAVQRRAGREPYRGFVAQADMGDPAGALPRRIYALEELTAALPEADFVILTLPLTPQTRHLLNARTLAATKPGVVILNVARGGVIETTALLAALDEGRLARAYLDVFESEPLPADSPLWTHPGVVVTPHMSGVMPVALELQKDLVRQNLRRYRAGEALLNEIPPERLRTP
ncbi:MAG: D-2-hydroxyacid dehydrogenase [Opitutaceae bacterium]|nr:D-2-hydroxyacid dehydrogenase [Opitutaceae bacterium]